MKTRSAILGAATGGMGAAGAATLASLCCVGPAVVATLGVGGAVAVASLAPYRLYLLLGAAALLGVGFWFAYRPRKC